uniref:Patched family protein n=1 Tax=Panagrolaimus superbus TaxID=310955 RepID=A0A914Z6U7_9BILA
MPFYAVCMVFVNNPGNFSNPLTVQKWNNLVSDFEELPSSVGKFSTKYWMRDYQEFVQNAEEAAKLVSEEVEDLELEGRKKNELRQFFEWPEFQHWHGFVSVKNDEKSGEMNLEKFFFTVASFGPELKEWSNRAKLLQEWRKVADSYPELNVSIYEDDAKFLDLIPTMIPQTAQSSFWTFICMILVCLLVMTHPTTVFVASIAIFSTCLGVFGFLSLWGIELDPIVMSCGIMSIGFSVDIPAHIAYHFYKSGLGKHGSSLSVPERIEHTLISVGFPVIEAGISTNICVLTLLFVDLHMAKVFVKTMVLVVSIGLIHGLVIIPVVFYLLSLIPNPWKNPESSSKFHDSAKMSAASTVAMIYTIEK